MSNKYRGIANLTVDSDRVLNVGHGSFVRIERIVGIFEAGSLPMKRWRDKATQENLLVDATKGRKTQSLILTDSNHVILSSIVPQTLQRRLRDDVPVKTAAEMELEEGEFVS